MYKRTGKTSTPAGKGGGKPSDQGQERVYPEGSEKEYVRQFMILDIVQEEKI